MVKEQSEQEGPPNWRDYSDLAERLTASEGRINNLTNRFDDMKESRSFFWQFVACVVTSVVSGVLTVLILKFFGAAP